MRWGAVFAVLILITISCLQFVGTGEDEGEQSVVENALTGEPGSIPVRDASDDAPWPQFKHDPQNTGMNPDAIANNSGRQRWKVNANSVIGHMSPSIYSGELLIGCSSVDNLACSSDK